MTGIPFKILCVDDSTSIRQYLTELLQSWNYDATACASGAEALESYRMFSGYSVILLDWIMPGMSGIEVCKQIRASEHQEYKYIIMLTSKDSTDNIVEALNAGADDYLVKPFQPAELKARIQTAFRFYQYEQKIKCAEYETRLSCYRALTELAEARDHETGQHLTRVSVMTKLLAQELGMDTDYQERLSVFAPMHDIGKVGIPDGILHLPRKLTAAEFEVIKMHTTIGYQILHGKKTMEMAAEIAYSHHEKWNGNGYPRNLQKEEIPLCSRIVSITDIYDALRSVRPYKQAYSHQDSVKWIYSEAGKTFDPDIVDAFRDVESEIKDIFEQEYKTFTDQP